MFFFISSWSPHNLNLSLLSPLPPKFLKLLFSFLLYHVGDEIPKVKHIQNILLFKKTLQKAFVSFCVLVSPLIMWIVTVVLTVSCTDNPSPHTLKENTEEPKKKKKARKYKRNKTDRRGDVRHRVENIIKVKLKFSVLSSQ